MAHPGREIIKHSILCGNTPTKQLIKIDVVPLVARLGETVGRSLRAKIDVVLTQ